MTESTKAKYRWVCVSALVFTAFVALFNATIAFKGMWLGVAAINFAAAGVYSVAMGKAKR